MEFENILKDLKNKVYHPVYFLQGEEPYFIDVITDYIANNVLSDMEREFNQTVLYGKDVDTLTIVSYAKRYPMMSNHQVVIIKEAQDLKQLENLESYIENPLKSTILVFCYKYKNLDKRLKFAKAIDKKAVLFTSSKLYENKIPDWITNYLKVKNYKINDKAAILIAEYLGNDLSKVSNELDKLMLNVPVGTKISVKHIEDNIGISKDFNVFELQTALGRKNVLKANQIAIYFAANQKNNPFVMTIGTLYSYFSKLLIYHTLENKSPNTVASALKVGPYFVGDYEMAAKNYSLGKLVDIINYLREYDLKSKGVDSGNSDGGSLLKELIYKILH
jgi:DNA polymerase-3 subunit delta